MKPERKTKISLGHHQSPLIELEHDLLHCWAESDTFTAIMQTSGTVYRAIEARKTIKFTHANKNYFIKKHFGTGWFEILKNLLFGRLPVIGAKNEYIALNRLQQLGIMAPRIAGYGEYGRNPAQQQSFLITHEIAQAISLDTLAAQWADNKLPWSLKQHLIKKIAYITAILHRNGINHRDLYACHFMISEPMTHHSDIVLMDLHRAQIRKKTPLRWIIKDLASLYYSVLSFKLTKRDLLRFIQYYSTQSWQIEMSKNEIFWQSVSRRSMKFMKRHHKFFPTPQ